MTTTTATTLFRTRVPSRRLQAAAEILDKLGLKPSAAINMFFAQVELRGGLPFEVTTEQKSLISAEAQGDIWNQQLGEY